MPVDAQKANRELIVCATRRHQKVKAVERPARARDLRRRGLHGRSVPPSMVCLCMVIGMFFCSVPQQGTRREHTQNSTSCGHFRFPHVSGVWVGVGVGHEHKATVHEAFLHGNPGYQPITNRSRSGNNRSCSRLHHIYKYDPCTSSCMQGAPTALTMH